MPRHPLSHKRMRSGGRMRKLGAKSVGMTLKEKARVAGKKSR